MSNRNGYVITAGISAWVAIIGIIGILIVGGYGLYWWLAKDTTEKRYDTNTVTQQYQQSLISENQDRVQDYYRATDPAQKNYLRDAFCTDVQRITVVPPDLASAKSNLC